MKKVKSVSGAINNAHMSSKDGSYYLAKVIYTDGSSDIVRKHEHWWEHHDNFYDHHDEERDA